MTLPTPPGYRELDIEGLRDFLVEDGACADALGGQPSDWKIEEVGDGNLNMVYIARGPAGGLAVKQALPYLRLVGESWPLPLERAYFENMALSSQTRHSPGLVPKVLRYDEKLYCIVMEFLSPHVIMRKGMIAGTKYPGFAEDVSEFMARNLFFTSDLGMPSRDKRASIAEFSRNTELCKITEDVIFTEPYMVADNNRWTAPYLDEYAKGFREDGDLKVSVNRLKKSFMSTTEALLHGDLHTGSVMVTEDSTKFIDPEFAFYGPMAFDTGKIIANLLISYFSQAGHEETPGSRDEYRKWILETTVEVWAKFEAKFLALWRDPASATGDGYPTAMFEGDEGTLRLERERIDYMRRLWEETVTFSGAFLVRRILGIAHNIDLEQIADERRRASCEARALELARKVMLSSSDFPSINHLVAAAESLSGQEMKLA